MYNVFRTLTPPHTILSISNWFSLLFENVLLESFPISLSNRYLTHLHNFSEPSFHSLVSVPNFPFSPSPSLVYVCVCYCVQFTRHGDRRKSGYHPRWLIAIEENSAPATPTLSRCPSPSMYSQCPKNIRRLNHPLRKHRVRGGGRSSTNGSDMGVWKIFLLDVYSGNVFASWRTSSVKESFARTFSNRKYSKANGDRDLTIVARQFTFASRY